MTDLASRITSEVPDEGTWTLDSPHSFVEFQLTHFNVGIAKGLAAGPTGTITIAPNLADSTVEAKIDASTVTTANPSRDEKILGPDVLEVEKYPTIDFSSSSLKSLGGQRYELDGQVTIHGVTKPLKLEIENRGVMVDLRGRNRLGLTATGGLDRNDFGAGDWGHVALALGGFMVPHEVKITLHLEAIKDEPEAS